MNVDPENVDLQKLMVAEIDLGSRNKTNNNRDSMLRKSLCPFVPSACF